MMKSPVVKFVSLATWLITAISAINVGLHQLNQGFVFPEWVNYLIGIAGAISLLLMILTLVGGCWCGKKGCPECHPDGRDCCGCGNKSCNGGCCNNKSMKNGLNSNGNKQHTTTLKTCAICSKPFGMCGCIK